MNYMRVEVEAEPIEIKLADGIDEELRVMTEHLAKTPLSDTRLSGTKKLLEGMGTVVAMMVRRGNSTLVSPQKISANDMDLIRATHDEGTYLVSDGLGRVRDVAVAAIKTGAFESQKVRPWYEKGSHIRGFLIGSRGAHHVAETDEYIDDEYYILARWTLTGDKQPQVWEIRRRHIDELYKRSRMVRRLSLVALCCFVAFIVAVFGYDWPFNHAYVTLQAGDSFGKNIVRSILLVSALTLVVTAARWSLFGTSGATRVYENFLAHQLGRRSPA